MTGIFVAWSDRKDSPGWVEDGTGCHIWIGCRTHDGYGLVRIANVTQTIHRTRYEREIGPIPSGLELDHLCRRGHDGCCNPRHCEPVSHQENTRRALEKTHCIRNHLLSGDNVINTKKQRLCRACQKIRSRRYYLKGNVKC